MISHVGVVKVWLMVTSFVYLMEYVVNGEAIALPPFPIVLETTEH